MSQQYPILNNQTFQRSLGFPLSERHRPSPNSGDLYLVEEAESLLSQFMGTSSQGPQESHDPTGIVVHGHTVFHTRPNNAVRNDVKPSNRWKDNRMTDNDPGPLPTVRLSYTPSHPPPTQPKENVPSRPGSYQRRRSPKSESSYEALSSDDDIVIPTRAGSAHKSSSPAAKPLVVKSIPETQARRSGRLRTEPTNYYQSLKLYQLEASEDSDSDMVTHSPRSKKRGSSLSNHKSRSTQPHNRGTMNHFRRSAHLDSLLRRRELGCRVNQQLHSSIIPDLKPYKSWKGASNDVVALAWSPDGTRFAAGATAQCDEHNMDYNRGNNLILGDLTINSLKELPDHWVPRPLGRSNQNMRDGRLFMSVADIQWFEDILLTASYDNTVKLWDATNHANTSCLKSLKHGSKVEVMDRSNFNPNILATGAESIGLWNIDDSTYSPLEVSKKDVVLVPASLEWGKIPATHRFLLAGMSEKDAEDHSVPRHGVLAMWYATESDMIPIQPVPSSQNVFDIKWHPSLPVFATAGCFGHSRPSGTAKDARSVVRLYEPLIRKSCTMEFDCPALDINDITFCPFNANYLTASCTDGITYVWDYRRPDQILHKLEHGEPLNQMDEFLSREQADVGVRLALWGGAMDQFYSGASDGVLKRWNILQSPEDVLIRDVISFGEEIMCGAFSGDKSDLLVGDGAGGIHVLSSSPFSHLEEEEEGNHQMRFERAAEPCQYNESDSESGVKAANLLLSSGQLKRHPIYGVGQGPYYNGPFAAWARPEGTPHDQLKQTPLNPGLQAHQLDGAPVGDRLGLSKDSQKDIQAQIQLARIRNRRWNDSKRKRTDNPGPSNYVNLISDEEDSSASTISQSQEHKKGTKKRKAKAPIITNVTSGVIDLTLSDPEEDRQDPEDDLDEDFWWPECIDPNIEEPGV